MAIDISFVILKRLKNYSLIKLKNKIQKMNLNFSPIFFKAL